MTKVKQIVTGLTICLFFALLTGCFVNKYNATLYSHAQEWIDETFLTENRVQAYYPDENDESGYVYDEESPRSRSFIIADEEEYGRIFPKAQCDIDFEKEMVILYIFGDVYPNREYYLKSMEIADNVLTVQTKLEERFPPVGDASAPYQRCFMIKMDKTEIKEVVFKK